MMTIKRVKRFGAFAMAAIMLLSMLPCLSMLSFAATEPVAVGRPALRGAVCGEPYRERFMYFEDDGYARRITMIYHQEKHGTGVGGYEEIEQVLPFTYNGLTFSDDGTVTGTPTKKEDSGNSAFLFGIKAEWLDDSETVVKTTEFYGYYHAWTWFSLAICDKSETVEIPDNAVEAAVNQQFPASDSVVWYKVTAVTDVIGISTIYKFGEDVDRSALYDASGVPAEEAGRGGGENEDGSGSGFISYVTNPGDTYYFYASGNAKLEIWDYNLYREFRDCANNYEPDDPEDFLLAETGVRKTFDGTEITEWDVYKLTFNTDWQDYGYSWNSGWGWMISFTEIISAVPVYFTAESESAGNLEIGRDMVVLDTYAYGNEYYSGPELKPGETAYYAGGALYLDCMGRLNGTSAVSLCVYVPKGYTIYSEDGALRINDGTHPQTIRNTSGSAEGITATCLPGCFDEPVRLLTEHPEQASYDWQKYEFDLSLRIGEEKMQSVYLIRTVNTNGDVVQPNEGYTVTLRIPIPAGCSPENCRIVHLTDDQGTSESFKLNPTGRAKPFTVSEDGLYLVIEVTSFSPFIVFTSPSIKLQDAGKPTLPFGEKRVLTADVENLPDGAKIVWAADNDRVELKPSADGKTCEVSAKKNGKVTVTATVVDGNGEPIESDGMTLSVSVELKTKANFFHKLFFWIFRIPWPFG